MADEEDSHDVFKETDESDEEVATEADTQVEDASKETDEKEEEESEGEKDSETPAEEDEKENNRTVPLAALTSERQKRQAAEEKLAKYETQNIPDRDKDPEGYERHMRVEVSRDVMREAHSDYDDTIAHFQEMAKANPELDRMAGEHKNPAKFAYDLAKEDMRIVELQKMSQSDDWKEFQKWKKSQPKDSAAGNATSSEQLARNKAALSVPNLNRATSVKQLSKTNEDDNVFAGSAF